MNHVCVECLTTCCFFSQSFGDYKNDNYKQVIVIRTDLGMGKGKAAAQCSHAAVGLYRKVSKHQPDTLRRWMDNGQPKVVLKTEGEEAL